MDWSKTIGISTLSNEFKQLEHILGDPEEKITYKDGISYNCYYSKGIAIALTSENKIDSIDFYQNHRRYSNVDASMLPSSLKITPDSTGKDILECYGEPDEKGSGGSEIWLDYPSFNVVIGSRDWNAAQDVKWTALTVF